MLPTVKKCLEAPEVGGAITGGGSNPVDTLILNFWPLELKLNFSVVLRLPVCYSNHRKLKLTVQKNQTIMPKKKKMCSCEKLLCSTIALSSFPRKEKRLKGPNRKTGLVFPAQPGASSACLALRQATPEIANDHQEVMSRSAWNHPRVSKLIIPLNNFIFLRMHSPEKVSLIV